MTVELWDSSGRRHELYLTAKGRKTLQLLRRDLNAHEDRFRQRFTKAEYTQFVEFLQRLYLDEE